MLTARDVMTHDVETVEPDDEVGDVLTRLGKAQFNGFPVVDSERGDLVGIVTQGDLVRLFKKTDRAFWIPVGLPPFLETVTYSVDVSGDDFDVDVDRPISEVMTTDVVTVAPDDDLDRLLELLSGEINRLPVLDGDTLVGIVTREDLIRAVRDERAEA
ncbi:HPP family protein [Halomarina rubra]|uniref:HPP family protein n=1 Tax=Halomarina rubra TaxID=2071873 RepID=A0ABD6AV78_9EURY|nr:CBS domain-containing protein [Halomarina rubra]